MERGQRMDQELMKRRTREFAGHIVGFCRQLPQTREGRLLGNQLFRSGTSVGANYRAACRGRSRADFISKLGIALEEADETLYWLELLQDARVVKPEIAATLAKEASELVAILVATLNTAKRNS